jgi:hypothetical protein
MTHPIRPPTNPLVDIVNGIEQGLGGKAHSQLGRLPLLPVLHVAEVSRSN